MPNVLDAPVFLIEDNPMDVELTMRAYEECEINNPLVIARDGEDAIRQIDNWVNTAQLLPRLILLDLRLPKIDGPEVLRHIRQSGHSMRYVPVVILTTSALERDLNECYALGASSYINKPVNFGQFVKIMHLIDGWWLRTNLVYKNE